MQKNTPASQAEDRAVLSSPAKGTWIEPTIDELPRLTELTLQTGNAIPGGGGLLGGGGSTVF